MSKKCEICGASIAPKFLYCRECNDSKWFPETLKIDHTFYKNGILRREVFVEIPEKISKLFSNGNMGMNKLRAFFCMLRNAYDALNLDKKLTFEGIKPRLWAIQRAVEDRTRRGVTPESFRQFVIHYLEIALQNKDELYGFVEFFRSVIAYSR